MTKIIASTNGTDEITIDAALLHQAQLTPGSEVSVELHSGGGMTIMPSVDTADAASTAQRLIKKNDELFRRLSQ